MCAREDLVEGLIQPQEPQLAFGGSCDVPGADLARVGKGQQLLLGEETYARLAEVFRSLADHSRAKIVYSLLHQELCTCDLAAITCLSEPAVSQHLRLLRNLRLVRTRREGRNVYYSLDDAHVRSLLTTTLIHLTHGTWVPPTSPAADSESEDGEVSNR